MLDGETGQFPCAKKDFGEHRAVEPTCVGVAQGWVIGGEKVETVGQQVLGAVGEGVLGFAGDNASVQEIGEVPVEGYLAEADDYSNAGQGLNLGGQVGGTVTNLLWEWLIAGWCAADDRGDPDMAKFEAVFTMGSLSLAGEAHFVEYGVHEIA